ncbi:kinase domain protein, putative (macronuclear) [Tetrahymena thermophila SB210]|uniref:Kinase domain protein, putative n=1 Tax=Tetrahymena thermophila (strain SB210) TaxID=312017 RepID=Q23G36_TETTS|nr:kinase domain protein, putative [Tetrahymena thermophila SB210]EAR95424.2 kinase domain protein, putative [Tetrahymena thermophila SB210]|eukprot:XP_001015669.2 kinase domain protein, putative [Tetrahymena thermophila SB210]
MNKLDHWKKTIQKNCKPASQALSIFIPANSNLGVEGCFGISEALKNVQNLKKLSLEIREYNKLGIQGFQILGKALSVYEFQELQLIFASEIGLDDQAVKEFFQQLNTTKSLLQFELEIQEDNGGYNHTELSGKYIRDFLKKQGNLQTLKIRYYDSFGNGGLQFVVEGIKELKQVNYLQFMTKSSSVSLKGIQNFFSQLQSMQGLQKLQLSLQTSMHIDNKQQKKGVNINGVKPICELLSKLPLITNLELEIPQGYKVNQEDSQLLGVILSEQTKLKSLTLVIFDFLNAGQQGMRDLIRGISRCSRLIKLNIFIDKFHASYSNKKVKNQLLHGLRLVNYKQYLSHIQYQQVQTTLQ